MSIYPDRGGDLSLLPRSPAARGGQDDLAGQPPRLPHPLLRGRPAGAAGGLAEPDRPLHLHLLPHVLLRRPPGHARPGVGLGAKLQVRAGSGLAGHMSARCWAIMSTSV